MLRGVSKLVVSLLQGTHNDSPKVSRLMMQHHMNTAQGRLISLLAWQNRLQVGEDDDDGIIVVLCLYFRSPSAPEMYLLLSCSLLRGTAAGKTDARETAKQQHSCQNINLNLHANC
jgi:hypothetical protein